jgi:ribonuclease HI
MEHLHTECRAARHAITTVTAFNPDTAAAFAQTRPKHFSMHEPLEKSLVCHIVALSHAVWAACRACDTKAPSPQRLKDATNTIISSFDLALQALTRTPKVHPRKRDGERREFLSLLRSLDRSATQYFTDGSSFGNPGPAGAGIAAFRNDTCIFSRCVSLGIASNNVAELEGLSAACDHALLTMADPTHGRATKIFFCDNRYALSMAEGKWRAKSNRHLINHVADKIKALKQVCTVLFVLGAGPCRHPPDIDVRYGFAVVRVCRPCSRPQAGAGL